MDHDALWALPGIGWICWTWGGAGPKWIRRWLWPLIVGVVGLAFVSWWRCLVSAVALILIHHLGYSPQRVSIVLRAAIAFSYGAALAPLLGFTSFLWFISGLTTMLWFVGSMSVSHYVHWWTHKWTEGGVGVLQGGWVAWALLR